MIKRTFSVIVVLLAMAFSSANTATAETGNNWLLGSFKDSIEGGMLKTKCYDVWVTLESENFHLKRKFSSDDGSFGIPDIPNGKFHVTIETHGYHTGHWDIELKEERTNIDFPMKPLDFYITNSLIHGHGLAYSGKTRVETSFYLRNTTEKKEKLLAWVILETQKYEGGEKKSSAFKACSKKIILKPNGLNLFKMFIDIPKKAPNDTFYCATIYLGKNFWDPVCEGEFAGCFYRGEDHPDFDF